MPKNLFTDLSSFSGRKKGSVEFQIFHLTDRVVKLTYHFRKHSKDYSSQRGLWKILGKRKRLLAYLSKSNFTSYEILINRLAIRGLEKN
uniref:Small ribosomal subunit protein uS15c n=1 Tax=Cyathodium smaragdinum TaxID=2846787 RepID=A0A8F2XVN3_9MARC|nr:ribosomal protein S15 [Cyathodium smaragdinum]